MQELQPTKDRINFELIEKSFDDVCSVIEDMALVTASAHLRGTGRKGSCLVDDLMEMTSKQGWDEELINYALKYKNTVIKNFNEFKKAYRMEFSNK